MSTNSYYLRLTPTSSSKPNCNTGFGIVSINGTDDQVVVYGHNAGVGGREDSSKVGWWLQMEYDFNTTISGPIHSEAFFQWTAADGSPVIRPISCNVDWTSEKSFWGLRGDGTWETSSGTQLAKYTESNGIFDLMASTGYYRKVGNDTPIVYGQETDASFSEVLRIDSSNYIRFDVGQNYAGCFFSTGTVYVGAGAPAASAKLECDSTTKGFLPPRMTTTQRDAISSPATGLTVYNTTTKTTDTYDGTAWVGQQADIGALTSNGASSDRTLVDVTIAGPTADPVKINANFDDVADAINDIRAALRAAKLMA